MSNFCLHAKVDTGKAIGNWTKVANGLTTQAYSWELRLRKITALTHMVTCSQGTFAIFAQKLFFPCKGAVTNQ